EERLLPQLLCAPLLLANAATCRSQAAASLRPGYCLPSTVDQVVGGIDESNH
uniref:Uncharacterized protein n=1 Tax=Aegilops tauschii subsp. strangulata TaxID=200361 RepID=A0A453NN37_AEGTS